MSKPLSGVSTDNFGEQSERWQAEGYNSSEAYPGYLMKRDGAKPGTSTYTHYVRPDGAQERLFSAYDSDGKKIRDSWQRLEGNDWKVLNVKNSAGEKIDGAYDYNYDSGRWEPTNASGIDTEYSGSGSDF
ncbi:MAG: hypothetical protein EBU49_09740 [Proteobacteria bacterium]|nr:hypothetical protein [Pseudomonadota bacterium]